jgi:hypothetical protein
VTATNEVGGHSTVQRNIIYDVNPPGVTIAPVTTPTGLQTQTLSGTMEAGSRITVTSSTAGVGTVTYPAPGTWSVGLTDMQPGDNTITVTATDSAGNSSVLHVLINVVLPPGTAYCEPWSTSNYWTYGINCTMTCSPGDWGFSVSVSVTGRDFDSAYIDGYGWVDPPGGTYGVQAQCVNGFARASVSVNDSTWNQSADTDISGWVEILNPGAHIVTALSGTGGSITPGRIAINNGATTSFTVTPAAGYGISSVTGCGGTLSGNTYVTGPVTQDCTVQATFAVQPALTCEPWSTSNYWSYGINCTMTCAPGDWGYFADVSVTGRDFDSAYIDGYGWVDPPGGTYTVRAQCVDGAAHASVSVNDSTWNQSAETGIDNWVAIPR